MGSGRARQRQSKITWDLISVEIGAEHCQKRDTIDGSVDEMITSYTRRFICQSSYPLLPGGILAAFIFDAVPPGALSVCCDEFRS